MLADLPVLLALVLHEGGWDEALMVAAGLGIAYLVIVWTGRKNQDEDDEDEALDEEEPAEATSSDGPPPSTATDEAPRHRS